MSIFSPIFYIFTNNLIKLNKSKLLVEEYWYESGLRHISGAIRTPKEAKIPISGGPLHLYHPVNKWCENEVP